MAVSPLPGPAVGSRGCCVAGRCCTTRRRNAHGTDVRELLYPWHPWAGCHLHIHEAVERAGSDIFRCSKTGAMSDRWLEIPAWMFDRAVCALVRIGVAPQVDIGTLNALARLLRAAEPVSALSISRAASSPHDSHSGGLNAAQVHDVAARSVLQFARSREHAATTMANPARADTPDADVADRAPPARPRRRRSCRGAAGDVR